MNQTQPKPYPPQTAGRLMTDKVPVVKDDAHIADVENLLFKETVNFETINYIYTVDGQYRLTGVLSVKELFRATRNSPVNQVSVKEVITIRGHTDQERAALLALKHSLKAVPVVNKDNRFLGVVPADKIQQVLNTEAVEDILKFGGVLRPESFDNILAVPIAKSLKHRLPWLLIGLLGGLLAAGIVRGFEETLSKNLTLAAFIPLVVYMADAVGTQMEAFIIRDMAFDPQLKFSRYFLRHLLVIIILGLVTSGLLYVGSLALYHQPKVSLVLGMALFLAILTSVFTGLIVPFVFGKLKQDPANASGPIATIIQDILSVFVYFSIASWLL